MPLMKEVTVIQVSWRFMTLYTTLTTRNVLVVHDGEVVEASGFVSQVG